jgi:hypothetical protein
MQPTFAVVVVCLLVSIAIPSSVADAPLLLQRPLLLEGEASYAWFGLAPDAVSLACVLERPSEGAVNGTVSAILTEREGNALLTWVFETPICKVTRSCVAASGADVLYCSNTASLRSRLELTPQADGSYAFVSSFSDVLLNAEIVRGILRPVG